MSEDETFGNQFPAEFLTRLRKILGVELESFRDGFRAKDPTFRVNTIQYQPADVCRELSNSKIPFKPTDWCPNAFWVPREDRDRLVRTAAFSEGRIYVQNASSLLPAIVLDPQPGESVLDLAAAPGGKTLHLACLMQNQGVLSAVEPIKSRFFRLRRNLELHGATMVKTYMTDGRTVGNKTGARFDKILLDAPCASEARMRLNEPDSWAFWSLRKIREQSRKQVGLLKSGLRALKPGGTLVYCTCSFAPEENELVLQKQLDRFEKRISIETIELSQQNQSPGLTNWNGKQLDTSLRKCCRILPTRQYDGFFLCKIIKSES